MGVRLPIVATPPNFRRDTDFGMSAQDQNPTGPTKAETLRGNVTITVELNDGTWQPVIVRQLPIREMERWLSIIDDEPAVAELFASQPEGWSELLPPESIERIVVEGERLNRDFFGRWLDRRTARKEWLAPVLARNAALQGSLPTGSPSLPSKPA